MREKELIKCESFREMNSEMFEMIKSALKLGFTVECKNYGNNTYMVSIYK